MLRISAALARHLNAPRRAPNEQPLSWMSPLQMGVCLHEVSNHQAFSCRRWSQDERQPRGAFWKGLKEVAGERDTTLSELVDTIDSEREYGNLSSALRLFVLDFYRTQLSDLKESYGRKLVTA